MRYGLVGYLILLGSATTSASTITVISSSGGSNDGTGCTLRDAITAANTDASFGECPAGNGDDVIDITAAGPITFDDASDSNYETALPLLQSNIALLGHGVVLRRDPALGTCAPDGVNDPGEFRLMRIDFTTISVSLDNLQISGFCADDAYAIGGAIQNYGTLTITNSILINNTAHDNGGAIFNDGTLNLTGTLLQGNHATGEGGALMDYLNSSSTIAQSAFVQNIAYPPGGSNSAGGAIEQEGAGAVSITNSTFSANQASLGAAIDDYQGTVHISFATFADQIVGLAGQAVLRSFQADLTLTSVLMGNVSNGVSCSADSGTFVALGANLSVDGSCPGFTLANTDPLLLPPAAENGTTPTYALDVGSPAVDAATNCLDANGQTVSMDQRGQTRPVYNGCDLGAYELQDRIFKDGFE
jgi:hypothetical protein